MARARGVRVHLTGSRRRRRGGHAFPDALPPSPWEDSSCSLQSHPWVTTPDETGGGAALVAICNCRPSTWMCARASASRVLLAHTVGAGAWRDRSFSQKSPERVLFYTLCTVNSTCAPGLSSYAGPGIEKIGLVSCRLTSVTPVKSQDKKTVIVQYSSTRVL